VQFTAKKLFVYKIYKMSNDNTRYYREITPRAWIMLHPDDSGNSDVMAALTSLLP